MNSAGLADGLIQAQGVGLNEPETMEEQQRLAAELEARGMPARDAAAAAGMEDTQPAARIVPEPAARIVPEPAAPEPEGTFDYGDLAAYGTRRAAESAIRGGTRLAEDWLDISDDAEEAGEAAAATVGPSAEQDERAAEFMEGKGIFGQAGDAIVQEAPTVAATVATGAAVGSMFGPGPGTLIGAGIGALLGVTRLYDEGAANLDAYNRDQIAAERGIAPEEVSDEEVRERFSDGDKHRATLAAAMGLTQSIPTARIISKLPGGRKPLQRATELALQRRSVMAGAGKEALTVGAMEAGQEVAEQLALDVLTNKQLHEEIRSLPEGDIREIGKFLYETKGEEYAVSFLAGFGLGGAPGAVGGAFETRRQNAAVDENMTEPGETAAGEQAESLQADPPPIEELMSRDRTRKIMGLAEQRGADLAELEERIAEDPAKQEQLGDIAALVDREQTFLDDAERTLEEAQREGASEDTLKSVRALRDRRVNRLDEIGDRIGSWLGSTTWKKAADVKRERATQDARRAEAARDRLKARGQRIETDVAPEEMTKLADNIDDAEAGVERAAARVSAVADPERRATAREELDRALKTRQDARIKAAQLLRGKTHRQAVDEVDKAERRERQQVAREDAVARQAEIEFPETMAEPERKARAQEIVDQFEARPMEGTRGLQGKIRRLQRRRRQATSPDTIAKLDDEIADLEARRALPPPAVEAARRVLQGSNEASQSAGLEAERPEAGTEAGEVPVATGAEPAATSEVGKATSDGETATSDGETATSDGETATETAEIATSPDEPADPEDVVRAARDVLSQYETDPDLSEVSDAQMDLVDEMSARGRATGDQGDLVGKGDLVAFAREVVARSEVEPTPDPDDDGPGSGSAASEPEAPTVDEDGEPIPGAPLSEGAVRVRQQALEAMRPFYAAISESDWSSRRNVTLLISKDMARDINKAARDVGIDPNLYPPVKAGSATLKDFEKTPARLVEAVVIESYFSLPVDARPEAFKSFEADARKGQDIPKKWLLGRSYKWRDLSDEPRFRDAPSLEALQREMGAWTKETGHEISAAVTKSGHLIAVGTNRHPWSVGSPALGSFDPSVISMHTHPGASPPSGQDIRRIVQTPGQVEHVIMDNGSPRVVLAPAVHLPKVERYQLVSDLERAALDAVLKEIDAKNPIANTQKETDLYSEAVAQSAEMAGLIDIREPYQGFDREDQELVARLVDRIEASGTIANIRSSLDGRPQSTEAGERGRAAREIRTGPEADIAAARRDGSAEPGPATGSEPAAGTAAERAIATDDNAFVEDVDDIDFDEEDSFALGGRPSTSRRGQRPPPGNPERLKQLADELYERGLNYKDKRTPKYALAIKSGELTREGLEQGIIELFQNNGNKLAHTIFFTATRMFPDTNFADINNMKTVKKKDRQTGKMRDILVPNKDLKDKIDVALQIKNEIEWLGHGEFIRVMNTFMTKRGMPSKNFFHVASRELEDFIEYRAPARAQFFQPLEDPNYTDQLVRDERSNKFDEAALEAPRRTARVLQRNKYTIDEAKLAALTPDDMISSKAIARMGLDLKKDEALAHFRRLIDQDPDFLVNHAAAKGPGRKAAIKGPPGWSKEDRAWMVRYGHRISENIAVATNKLKNLRVAYEMFRKEHGPDAKIGFMYQIDDRGRIYADGEFHPQAGGEVKGLFVDEKGRNLVDDMRTVDASASGWQITGLMARDHVLAPRINLGRGQALDPEHTKQDLYTSEIGLLREGIERDAAGGPGISTADRNMARRLLPIWDSINWNRNMVKAPIVAVNYGGRQANFVDAFYKTLRTPIDESKQFEKGDKPYGYLARKAVEALEQQAPHAMAFENWALDSIENLVAALGKKYGPGEVPDLQFRVGHEGRIQSWKPSVKDIEIKPRATNRPRYKTDAQGRVMRGPDGRKIIDEKLEDDVTHHIKLRTDTVNPSGTAKSVWANLVQGFDASVLHRTIERYDALTDGDFITTNHDSFTVPPEREGLMSSLFRDSMKEIMGDVDVPRRLYEDVMAFARHHGVADQLTSGPDPFLPFDNYGEYNLDDLDTATPVFGEAADGSDYVPEYAVLPDEELSPLNPERPALPENVRTMPSQAAEPDQSQTGIEPESEASAARPLLDRILPETTPEQRAEAVRIPEFLQQLEEANGALQGMQNAALNPGRFSRRFFQKLEDTVFNAFAPIRRLEIDIKGGLPPGVESVFKNAEMAVNDTGRQEMLLYAGAAKFGPNGEYEVDPDTMGLKQIFDLAGHGQDQVDWQHYLIAKREQELQKRGDYKPLLTKAQIAEGLAKGEGKPQFDQAAAEWKKFNDANLRFLRDSGRINNAQLKAMSDDAQYVPFYRSDERIDGVSPELDLSALDYRPGVSRAGGLLSRDPGIHKIIGGDTMRVQNLMLNMMRNSQAMVAAGMRNRAANKVFDLMKDAGMADTMPISAKKPDKYAERMWKNGNEVWVIPRGANAQPVMIALASLQPTQLNAVMQFGATIAQVFRQGITLTPPFMIRNAIRGAVSAGVLTTGANMTANNTLTGFKDVLKKGPATQAFKATAGMGDYRFGNPDAGFGRNDILIEFGLGKETAGYRFRRFMEKLETVGTATELADRIAAMNTMIERGMRKDEAAYQALTIMNYSRRGSSQTLRMFLPLLPFLNARLQGWSRLTEGAVGRRGDLPRGKALMQMGINGGLLMLAGGLIWGWNNLDEERREEYRAEPLWRRLNYHIIKAGELTLYIPKAFEIGHAFNSIPELYADANLEQLARVFGAEANTPDDIRAEAGLKKIFADTIAFNFVPQAMKPFLELSMNYDFFTQRPIEGLRETQLEEELRTQNASALTTFIGQQLGLSDVNVPVAGKISPSEMEHFLRSYGGIYYVFSSTMFQIIAGDAARLVGSDKMPMDVAAPFGDVPVLSPALKTALGSFMNRDDLITQRFVEEFYEAGDHVSQLYLSAKEAVEGKGNIEYARRLATEAPNAGAAHKMINSAERAMGEINREIRHLRVNGKIGRREKAEQMGKLIQARNRISRSVMRQIRAMEEQQGKTFKDAS